MKAFSPLFQDNEYSRNNLLMDKVARLELKLQTRENREATPDA